MQLYDMGKNEDWAAFMLLGAVLALVAFAYFSQPSEEDILKCVETTSYTAERCEWEITR